MLTELRVRNLAVIEEHAVRFAPGLNVLTGETGAGKSIVIDALLLVAGARAQPDLIRSDAEAAMVEAAFEVDPRSPAAGPNVVKTVTHEDVSFEQLGGADIHAGTSGVAHFVHDSEPQCLAAIRELVGFLPSNNLDPAPVLPTADPEDRRDEALLDVIPANATQPYDMHDVIRRVVDDGLFHEVHGEYAGNILVGFARLGGQPVGVVANQPAVLAGVLDINASVKGARFIRFCDAFNIPLVTFEDVPGFLPGTEQEWGGIIVHGDRLQQDRGHLDVARSRRPDHGRCHPHDHDRSFVAGAMYSGLASPAFTEVSGTVEVVEGDLGNDSGGISRGTSIKTTDFSYTWTQASDDDMALVVAISEDAAPAPAEGFPFVGGGYYPTS